MTSRGIGLANSHGLATLLATGSIRTCRSATHSGTAAKSQAPVSSSQPETGAKGSDLGVFGKGQRVLHVDPEIPHGILDLAVT